MQKIYNTPILHIVSINKNNVIATSNLPFDLSNGSVLGNESAIGAPDRFNDWDAGY